MKDKIISIFTRNPLLKLLSLGVSFVLWLVVVNYDDPTITKAYSSVPVELTNTSVITDAGQVYELSEDSQTVTVNVKAKRSVHNNLDRDDLKATADLTRVDADGNVPVEIKATRQADRIDSLSLKGKSSIKLNIEDLLEKQFNIQTEIEGEPGEDFMVGSRSLDRNVVKVSGPVSKVSRVARAGVTVDISGMTQDISTTEDIYLYDENGDRLKLPDVVMSRTTVGVTVQLWKIRTVPVSFGYVGEPADGYVLSGVNTIEPQNVRIAGMASQVDGITSLSIPAADVDISGVTADYTADISLKDYLGTGFIFADDDFDGMAKITIGVSELDSRVVEVPVSNIAVINVPEDLQHTVGGLGEVMALKVQGLSARLEELNPMLILGVIDVEALKIAGEDGTILPGVYDAPVVFSYPDGIYDGGNSITAQLILRNANGIVPQEEE